MPSSPHVGKEHDRVGRLRELDTTRPRLGAPLLGRQLLADDPVGLLGLRA